MAKPAYKGHYTGLQEHTGRAAAAHTEPMRVRYGRQAFAVSMPPHLNAFTAQNVAYAIVGLATALQERVIDEPIQVTVVESLQNSVTGKQECGRYEGEVCFTLASDGLLTLVPAPLPRLAALLAGAYLGSLKLKLDRPGAPAPWPEGADGVNPTNVAVWSNTLEVVACYFPGVEVKKTLGNTLVKTPSRSRFTPINQH